MDNKQKNAFLKCMDIVDKIVREICIFLMFVMLVLVLLQVVSRYLLPVSLSWTEELARFTMLWLIFLASSHIARKSSYIRVTFIIDRQPDKVKRVISVIVKTIVLITAAHYTWNCFNVFTTVSVKEVSPTMQMPMVIPRFALVVGLALTFLQALAAGGLKMLDEEEEA